MRKPRDEIIFRLWCLEEDARKIRNVAANEEIESIVDNLEILKASITAIEKAIPRLPKIKPGPQAIQSGSRNTGRKCRNTEH